jgi:hypothetical protein
LSKSIVEGDSWEGKMEGWIVLCPSWEPSALMMMSFEQQQQQVERLNNTKKFPSDQPLPETDEFDRFENRSAEEPLLSVNLPLAPLPKAMTSDIDIRKKKAQEEVTKKVSAVSDRKSNIPLERESKYGRLVGATLYLYDTEDLSHSEDVLCSGMILLEGCKIDLVPEGQLRVENYFKKEYPIRIRNDKGAVYQRSGVIYLFARSAIEKEDWWQSMRWAAGRKSDDVMNQEEEEIERIEAVKEQQMAWQEKYIRIERLHRADYFIALSKQLDKRRGIMDKGDENPSHLDDLYFSRLDPNAQWMNALLGRIFYNIYRSEWLHVYFMKKFHRKTSKLKRPSFLSDVIVTDVQVGETIPLFSHIQLLNIQPTGELLLSAFLDYTGDFKVTVTTQARLDTLRVAIDLVLSMTVKQVSGRILIRIKPPPTDRLWIGFFALPKMQLVFEPLVSTKSIKWSLLHSLMEKRVTEAVQEYLVLPAMEDFVIPAYQHPKFFQKPTDDKLKETLRPQNVDFQIKSSTVPMISDLRPQPDNMSDREMSTPKPPSINSEKQDSTGKSSRAGRMMKTLRLSVSNFTKNYWNSTNDGLKSSDPPQLYTLKADFKSSNLNIEDSSVESCIDEEMLSQPCQIQPSQHSTASLPLVPVLHDNQENRKSQNMLLPDTDSLSVAAQRPENYNESLSGLVNQKRLNTCNEALEDALTKDSADTMPTSTSTSSSSSFASADSITHPLTALKSGPPSF